jgi:probable DNA metabolism protein
MIRLIYDGSFEGFLTCVFELYERKSEAGRIVRSNLYQPLLEEEVITITADATKANRVWSGLNKKTSTDKLIQFYKAFLSERVDMEDNLLGFIRYVFNSSVCVEKDYSNKSTLYISQIAKQVHREKHRMEAFIRFQLTTDNIYYAAIEPDFNALPLIVKHFKDRYADQHWIIYDRKRNYGIQYSAETYKVTEIQLNLTEETDRTFLPESVVAEEEPHYQQLWQQYFTSVNISLRKNTKLHVRHVPLRYWKYLTEKMISIE